PAAWSNRQKSLRGFAKCAAAAAETRPGLMPQKTTLTGDPGGGRTSGTSTSDSMPCGHASTWSGHGALRNDPGRRTLTTEGCDHPFGIGYDKKHDVVYVACQQFFDLTAIDARTNTRIGDPIEVGSSPFGIVYDQRNGDVYVAIAHTDEVVVLDADTRTVSDRIPVGVAPFGIAFDTRRGYLYVTNSQADTVSVIDGATNTVVRTIPLAAGPLPAGLSPMGIVY